MDEMGKTRVVVAFLLNKVFISVASLGHIVVCFASKDSASILRQIVAYLSICFYQTVQKKLYKLTNLCLFKSEHLLN